MRGPVHRDQIGSDADALDMASMASGISDDGVHPEVTSCPIDKGKRVSNYIIINQCPTFYSVSIQPYHIVIYIFTALDKFIVP